MAERKRRKKINKRPEATHLTYLRPTWPSWPPKPAQPARGRGVFNLCLLVEAWRACRRGLPPPACPRASTSPSRHQEKALGAPFHSSPSRTSPPSSLARRSRAPETLAGARRAPTWRPSPCSLAIVSRSSGVDDFFDPPPQLKPSATVDDARVKDSSPVIEAPASN